MSVLKKMFGAGDARDDEIMYQTEGGNTAASTATENTDRDIQSSRDVGTGAQNKEGIVSKIGNTGNVESQTAGTSASPSAVASTGDSNTGRNTAIAGAGVAGAAGAAATVYASDRVESDDKQDDISKATYTERSYALSSDSTTNPTTSETMTAEYPTGYSRDPNAPGAVGAGAVGAAAGLQKEDSGVVTGLGLGGVAAAGAGGAAIGAANQRHTGFAPVEREGYYGRPPSSPPASPPQSPTATQSEFGRDAAIAGGAAAAAGAVGYGAYEASRGGVQDTDPKKVEEIEAHYARNAAGAGAVTTVGAGAGYPPARDDGNQVATDSTGRALSRDDVNQSNDDDRVKDTGSGAVKEVETHYGRDAAAVGAVTALGAGAGYAVASSDDKEPGEKKQGFFSKVLRGEKKEHEIPFGDSNPSNEVERVPPPGTVGSSADDAGMITIVKEGADPDAPALVVRERPGGGIETLGEAK